MNFIETTRPLQFQTYLIKTENETIFVNKLLTITCLSYDGLVMSATRTQRAMVFARDGYNEIEIGHWN